MRRAAAVLIGVCATVADAQEAHNAFIWIEGPMEVLEANTTYTLEVWARFESPLWDSSSAMAGFGIGVDNDAGENRVAAVENIDIEDWAEGFGWIQGIDGTDIVQVSGGQLAQIFCCHQVDRSNPIRLFTFDIRMAATVHGTVGFTPAWPNPNGGLSFYPDSQDGAAIIAPNDVGTALILEGWTSVPAPGGVAVAAAVLVGVGRRRSHRPAVTPRT